MMPSLMIDHLSINLRSGTDNLVSEISFAIKEGESLILLGQSGSGKTMTCSAVLNLLDPKKFKVSGSVFFGETDLLNSSEKQRRGIYGNQIVYIPQNPMTALDPSMRIGRQMDETLRLHSDKSRQQRYNYILRLLHDVGLDDSDRVYRAYPHMLSGGMLQRVIIAMAMMLDAKFVLADEPTTALDVTIQAQILELMKKLQKQNHMGIIFITHNLGVVAEICDKVSVMYAGKIVEQGPVDDIFYAPGHPYTRGLLRSMPRVDADSYERLIPIEGTPIDMLNPPEGCPFAPRCESAMKICLQKMPPYVELGENHRSACWLCVQQQIKAQKEAAKNNNEKMEADNHE